MLFFGPATTALHEIKDSDYVRFSLLALSSIFFLVDPFAAIGTFMAITAGEDKKSRSRTARRGARRRRRAAPARREPPPTRPGRRVGMRRRRPTARDAAGPRGRAARPRSARPVRPAARRSRRAETVRIHRARGSARPGPSLLWRSSRSAHGRLAAPPSTRGRPGRARGPARGRGLRPCRARKRLLILITLDLVRDLTNTRFGGRFGAARPSPFPRFDR